MSKPLNRTAAATAWANGSDDVRTQSNLTFIGDVAYSYGEPIAFRHEGHIFCTDASFSMTTAHHRSAIVNGWVRSDLCRPDVDTFHSVGHRAIRRFAAERGLPLGSWGRHFDREGGRTLEDVIAGKLEGSVRLAA